MALSAPPTRPRTTLALIVVFGATFIVLLDTSIVTLALPAVRDDLHAGIAATQWIVDAFSLVLCAGLLTGGTLCDKFGPMRMLSTGLLTYVLGSLLCALAPNVALLVAGRALQGAAACLTSPAAIAVLTRLCPEPRRRAQMLGWVGLCASLALATGPLLGGVLTDLFGWPTIFLINVPIGLAIFALSVRCRAADDTRKAKLDVGAQLLAIVAVGALTYAIIEASWLALLPAVVAGALFVRTERRSTHPMLPLPVLSNRELRTAVLALFGQGFAVNSPFYLLSLYLQGSRGLSATVAGVQFLPYVLSIVAVSVVVGRVATRLRPVWLMAGGFLGCALCLAALCTLTAHTPIWLITLLFVLLGVSTGIAVTPGTILAVSTIEPRLAGTAAAISNVSRQFGVTIGIAALGAVLAAGSTFLDGLRSALFVGAGVSVVVVICLLLGSGATRPRRGARTTL